MVQISKIMKIVLVVTVALFAVSLVCLGVSLALELIDGGDSYVSFSEGGGGKSNNSTPSTPAGSISSGVGAKTGIVLPSATEDKSYLGTVDATTKDITDDEDIKSAAMVLVDITDNKIVAGKSADVKIYPASMTKVMTLLVACENAKDPNALLTVTAEMYDKYMNGGSAGGSTAFEWLEGYQVTVEDALHLIIYKSDTFACWLIAEYVAGGENEFVAMMNQRATAMGLTGTHFTNCTGLYNDQHYTTAREMAAIMAAAMNNAAAKTVLTKYDKYTVDVHHNGETLEKSMWSGWYTGRLEVKASKYNGAGTQWPGGGSDVKIVGGKTGYEEIPTNCFVTAGIDDITGREYVCVQVGRIDKTQNTIDSTTSTRDTRAMYRKYAKEPE